MSGIDRERIVDLLADDSLSYREIGRLTGASDWTVRRIARELDGDARPMKQRRYRSEETAEGVSPISGWLIFGGFAVCLALMIWAGMRWNPPPGSGDFP